MESIGLSGWQGLHFEHLRSLLQDCPQLARIDLSDVSVSILNIALDHTHTHVRQTRSGNWPLTAFGLQ